jgi:SAM-dependent methyltransferase
MDDTDNRAIWDRKYQEGLPSLARPDPFFISVYERLVDQAFPNAGTALDLAAGLGRHALWLAERAWQVSAVDVSEVAIGKLSQTAAQLNVKIKLFAIDAAEYDFDTARFDLIVLFYHLDRTLFPKIVSALNPGRSRHQRVTSNHWGRMNSRHSCPTSKPLPTTSDQSVIGEWSNSWERSRFRF